MFVAVSRSATQAAEEEEEGLCCDGCQFLSRHLLYWAVLAWLSDVCCVAGKRRATGRQSVGVWISGGIDQPSQSAQILWCLVPLC